MRFFVKVLLLSIGLCFSYSFEYPMQSLNKLKWVPSAFSAETQSSYCKIALKEIGTHSLEKSVQNLIKKSCSTSSQDISLILNQSMKDLPFQTQKMFFINLSESHPDAQKRLFNKITSLSPKQLNELVKKIAGINCRRIN